LCPVYYKLVGLYIIVNKVAAGSWPRDLDLWPSTSKTQNHVSCTICRAFRNAKFSE